MMRPPFEIDNARVLFYAEVSPEMWEGRTRHMTEEDQAPSPAGLAICQYEGDPGFYLFRCSARWSTLADTWHDSIAAAMDQAEYEGGQEIEFDSAAA